MMFEAISPDPVAASVTPRDISFVVAEDGEFVRHEPPSADDGEQGHGDRSEPDVHRSAIGTLVRREPAAQLGAVEDFVRQIVQLHGFENRRPAQLSGGQQQRVSLARALVFEPALVLMDEPLGALDKQLREHMQIEIKHLHSQVGVTVVYVTHDQSEALTMSDRIVVFNEGEAQQIAPPDILYEKPGNAFVAEAKQGGDESRGRIGTARRGTPGWHTAMRDSPEDWSTSVRPAWRSICASPSKWSSSSLKREVCWEGSPGTLSHAIFFKRDHIHTSGHLAWMPNDSSAP